MAKRRGCKADIGQTAEEAMGIVYQVGAQEVARMMQNATRSQQCLQIVSYAATATIVEQIIAAATKSG